jgi:DNA-binding response OmpR family regulator
MYKILIVDDEESIQILYADELTEDGYDVVAACDCANILELIEQQRPDLVVLDIKLDKQNGLDLLMEIRNTYYDLPVILCSAYSVFRDDIRCIAADYYVAKDSKLDELKSKIKFALQSGDQFFGGYSPCDGDVLQNAL